MRESYLLASAALCVASYAHAVVLVNDTFSDTDRASSPTSTNTQWITDTSTPLTPSESGMLWDSDAGTGSRYALGYFPLVTVSNNETTPTVFTLEFTTGASGATASNLRIALLDTRPNGTVVADGGAGNSVYVDDVGYGFFSSASTVGGGNTTALTLRTYQRNTLTSTNPLSAAGDWGNNSGTTQLANSSGSSGYFQANTSYSLNVSMLLTSGSLAMTTSLTGGNFSGLSYTATDAVTPTTDFNALIFRLGGNGQFADINFTSLTISGVSAVPEPSSYAAFAGLGVLGLATMRRRRTDA